MAPLTVRDKRGVLGASLVVTFIVLLGNLPRLDPGVTQFGSEYGWIADSLARGEGFSNPFGEPTGPTAWMPPGYVWMMALVFKIFGPLSQASAVFLLLLKAVGLSLAVYLLVQAARAYGLENRERLAWSMGVAFIGGSWWVSGELFDRWTSILLTGAFLVVLARARHGVLVGALAPLFQPVLAFGFAVVLLWRRREGTWVWKVLAALLLTSLCWSVRNLIAVGAPYPIKSNAAFEFYMSNALDQDGILSSSTLQRFHPSHSQNAAAEEYRNLGEREFLLLYRKRSLELVLESPLMVLRKITARLRNTLVWLEPLNDISFVSPRVDERDQRVLINAGLLRSTAYYQYWLVTGWDMDSFKRALDGLELADRRRAFLSWAHAKLTVQRNRYAPTRLLWGFAFAGLPLLAILVGLRGGAWACRSFREPAVLYLIFLLPYQLISHYARYQMAALGLQVWLVWWVFLRGSWWGSEEPHQPPAGGSGTSTGA